MIAKLNVFQKVLMGIKQPIGKNLMINEDIRRLSMKLKKETIELFELHNTISKDYSRLISTLDILPAIVFIKDKENRITYANEKFFKSTDTDKDILNIILHEVDTDDQDYKIQAKKYYSNDLEVIRTGLPKLNIIEKLYLPGNGNEVKIYKTDKLPLIIDGKIEGIIGFSIDLEEMCGLLKLKGIC